MNEKYERLSSEEKIAFRRLLQGLLEDELNPLYPAQKQIQATKHNDHIIAFAKECGFELDVSKINRIVEGEFKVL